MRLPISRIDGRSPKASVQIIKPGCDPLAGWMKAASQGPSGVLISTFASTTGIPAPDDTEAAANPAATDATKSRRCGFRLDLSSAMKTSLPTEYIPTGAEPRKCFCTGALTPESSLGG